VSRPSQEIQTIDLPEGSISRSREAASGAGHPPAAARERLESWDSQELILERGGSPESFEATFRYLEAAMVRYLDEDGEA
jgi:hypothetical protein